MRRPRLLLGLLFLVISFILFLLSLLSLFPKTIAALFLFLSVFFTVATVNNRHRFRGFE